MVVREKHKFNANNFDLIRLAAALQVAFFHSAEHLKVDLGGGVFLEVLRFFPGVPIFFFISGYLISRSYEKNNVLIEYAQNRVLRIYPALIICILLATLSVFVLGYLSIDTVDPTKLIVWILSQSTFLQFYNPDFMRGYGVGVLNGSLWTICVELQFYFMVPLVYQIMKVNNKSLLVLLFVFVAINRAYFFFDEHQNTLVYKLIGVSFAPWFCMFVFGILVQKNVNKILNYVSGRSFYLVFGYIVLAYFAAEMSWLKLGNAISPLLFFPLALAIFSLAYDAPGLSGKVLGRNDISYGIYIYHMPVVNALLYVGFGGATWVLLVALISTFVLAIFSWKLIEKPSLGLKRHPLNPFAIQ
jgi:peptidoglycan/LPS O-acetylase OafA/YrhL